MRCALTCGLSDLVQIFCFFSNSSRNIVKFLLLVLLLCYSLLPAATMFRNVLLAVPLGWTNSLHTENVMLSCSAHTISIAPSAGHSILGTGHKAPVWRCFPTQPIHTFSISLHHLELLSAIVSHLLVADLPSPDLAPPSGIGCSCWQGIVPPGRWHPGTTLVPSC